MTDIITREQAIACMAKGEKVETSCTHWETGPGWTQTRWEHFDPAYSHAKFRIPPEPRREAREWFGVTRIIHDGGINPLWKCFDDPIHVREVLPDEVVLRKMTERGWIDWIDKNAHNRLDLLRALGLIVEDGK